MATYSNETALVVDDSATMRTILREMLTRIGFRSIEEADSGETALARLKTHTYSLIVSDWNMGSMSGIDLLREFKKLRVRSTSRFIFATSERSWGHQTSAKLDGADAFISKPFGVDALRAKVDMVYAR